MEKLGGIKGFAEATKRMTHCLCWSFLFISNPAILEYIGLSVSTLNLVNTKRFSHTKKSVGHTHKKVQLFPRTNDQKKLTHTLTKSRPRLSPVLQSRLKPLFLCCKCVSQLVLTKTYSYSAIDLSQISGTFVIISTSNRSFWQYSHRRTHEFFSRSGGIKFNNVNITQPFGVYFPIHLYPLLRLTSLQAPGGRGRGVSYQLDQIFFSLMHIIYALGYSWPLDWVVLNAGTPSKNVPFTKNFFSGI